MTTERLNGRTANGCDYALALVLLASVLSGCLSAEMRARRRQSRIEAIFYAFADGDPNQAVSRLEAAEKQERGNARIKGIRQRLEQLKAIAPINSLLSLPNAPDQVNEVYLRGGIIQYVFGPDLNRAINQLRYYYFEKPHVRGVLSVLNFVEHEAGFSEPTVAVDQPCVGCFVAKKMEDAALALSKGDLDLAAFRLVEVLSLEPGNYKALNLLGVALLEGGEVKEAHLMLLQAHSINPKDKECAEQFLRVEQILWETDRNYVNIMRLKDGFSSARTATLDEFTSAYRGAMESYLSGGPRAATRLLEEIVHRDPNNKRASITLRRMRERLGSSDL